MVNVYGNPPVDENAPAKTAEEAEARAGAQVGFRGTYGGAKGRAAQNYEIVKQQDAQRQAQQQQGQPTGQQAPSERPTKYMGWEQDQRISDTSGTTPTSRTYLEHLDSRPGYYNPSTLGNTETQRRVAAGENMGTVLEQQRKAAELTPGTRDDQYFLNELSKWNRTGIETSSEYHTETLATGQQQKANPYENWGDVALAIEKGGGAQKDFTQKTYGFNPNVGGALGVLPGGQGLQETAWGVAKSRQPANVDFQPAVDYLNSQKSRMGPYGNLYGGIPDAITPTPVTNAKETAMGLPVIGVPSEASAKRPFTSVNAPGGVSQPTGKDWNSFVASAAEPIGYIGEGKLIGQPEPKERGTLPAGVFLTGGFGLVTPGDATFLGTSKLIDKPGAVSFSTNLALMGANFAKTGDAGELYRDFTQSIAMDITHVLPSAKGLGKYVETTDTSKSPLGTVVSGAAYVGEQVYTNVREDPVQDLALFLLPLGFKMGEAGISSGIAKAAVLEGRVANTVGRALSTPLAINVGNVAKAGLVTLYTGQSLININVAPNTPEGKGRAIGDVGYQVGMMALGVPAAASYAPKATPNPYESKTFFTGERKLPVTEKIMIRAGDWVNSYFQTKGQKASIQDVSTEYMGKSASFTKPEITTTEPELSQLTHVGPKNAPLVKSAMVDQPSVMYGSGTIKAQVNPKTPMGKVLFEKAGTSADADVFTEFPAVMEAKAGRAAKGMDVHTFPEGYIDVGQGSNAPVKPGSYLFGNRYRTNPYEGEVTLAGKTEGYTGEIGFEHLNVGFRKYSSAVRDDLADPMNKGYRLGKDVSRLTRSRDYLEETRISRGGKPSDSAFDNMLKQKITYSEMNDPVTGKPLNVRTETLEAIRARYENSPKDIPDAFTKYSKGAISSGLSPLAPGSIISLWEGASPSPLSSSPSSIKSVTPSSKPPSIKKSQSPSSSPIGSYLPSLVDYSVPSAPAPTPSTGSPFVTVPPYSPPTSTPPSYVPSYSPPPISPPGSIPPSYVPPYSPPYSPPPSSTPPYVPPYYPPGTPFIPGLPSFPGGSGLGGMMPSPRKRRSVTPWGLDVSTFGKSRPTLTRQGTYAVPRQPRQKTMMMMPIPALPKVASASPKKGRRKKK